MEVQARNEHVLEALPVVLDLARQGKSEKRRQVMVMEVYD